jgi:hypothetical protein
MDRETGMASQQRWRIRMLLLHGIMLLVPPVLMLLHPYHGVFNRTFCLWKRLSGYKCPACGITRSAGSLLTGHWRESLTFHPAGPVIVTILVLLTVYLSAVTLFRSPGLPWRREVNVYQVLDSVMVVTLVLVWIGKAFT